MAVNKNETKTLSSGGTGYRNNRMDLYIAPFDVLWDSYYSSGSGVCRAVIKTQEYLFIGFKS